MDLELIAPASVRKHVSESVFDAALKILCVTLVDGEPGEDENGATAVRS